MNDIHVGDVGTQFRVTLQLITGAAFDISDATGLVMRFQKPDQSSFSRTASLLNTGTDGIVYYATVSGDLDAAGSWQMQVWVTKPTGLWHSDITKFKVKANI